MHKHFRMISISENLRNHGYNGYATQKYSHTRIPGIWEKLGTLYNLEALDIRVCLRQIDAAESLRLTYTRKTQWANPSTSSVCQTMSTGI